MKKNAVIIISIVVILLVAYMYFNQSSAPSASYLVSNNPSTDSADAKYIYNILQQMAKVTLNDSIFSDPVFQSLKDNTVSFPAQAAGRSNPFAPVGSISAPTNQSTTSSAIR